MGEVIKSLLNGTDHYCVLDVQLTAVLSSPHLSRHSAVRNRNLGQNYFQCEFRF